MKKYNYSTFKWFLVTFVFAVLVVSLVGAVRVGVGMTPDARLHVNGDIKAQGKIFPKGEGIGEFIMNGMDNESINDWGLAFYTRFTNRLYIANNGNVGIGTTTPGEKLTVVRPDATAISALSGSSTAYTSVAIGRTVPEGFFGIAGANGHWVSDSVAGDIIIRAKNATTQTGQKIHFGAGPGPATMTITDTSVGIGTTTPGGKLEVYGGENIVLKDDATPGDDPGDLVFQTSDGTENGRVYSFPDTIRISAGTDVNAELVINSNGRVGIGTASPQAKLEIDTPEDPRVGYIRLGGGGDMMFDGGNDKNFFFSNLGGAGGYTGFGNGQSTSMVITNDGKVGIGIGNAAPKAKLEVNGMISSQLASGRAMDVCASGEGYSAVVYGTCGSSKRYKKEIQNLNLGLKTVKQLRPVAFKWKDSGAKDLGFVAEEVSKINPILATYKNGKVEGVKYKQLTAVLTNAIVDQQGTIESLQKGVEELKKIVCFDHPNTSYCRG